MDDRAWMELGALVRPSCAFWFRLQSLQGRPAPTRAFKELPGVRSTMPAIEGALELPAPLADQATWLDERVALLETQAPFPSSNSLLVTDGDETVLVDTGLGEDALAELAALVDEVVLTHFHLDHVLFFDRLPELPVTVPEVERPVFEGRPFPRFVGAEDAVAKRFEASFGDVYPSFHLDPSTFEPGDALDLAGTRWEVVPAPGHSPGHPMLHETERSILFSVDVEFGGMGPWYAWPHCDPTAFEQAVEAARERFRDARVVATSHSPPIVEDPEAVEAALDRFQAHYGQRDQAVLEALRAAGAEGRTLDELVDEVRIFYGDHVEKNQAIRYWCRVMTRKHLERLEVQDRAEPTAGGWRPTDPG